MIDGRFRPIGQGPELRSGALSEPDCNKLALPQTTAIQAVGEPGLGRNPPLPFHTPRHPVWVNCVSD